MTPYEEGKQLYRNNDFINARLKFEEAINRSYTPNKYHYNMYGWTLRKLDESQYFLQIISPLLEQEIFNVNDFLDLLVWCQYDVYIKKYKEDCDYDILEKADFILSNCQQLDLNNCIKNPFVLTIFKIVKVLKKRASINYKKIVELLEKIDPMELPLDDEFEYEDSNYNKRETSSKREFYYQNISSAYEKTMQYEKCIEICEKALEEDMKLHFRNKLWFTARLHYCKCKISTDFGKDINEYKKIIEKHRFWYMYHKLSALYWSKNDIDNALYYSCLSFDIIDEMKKKVNVMSDIGDLLIAKGDESNAVKFFQCALYYRTINGWGISRELEYQKILNNIDVTKKPNLLELKKISLIKAISLNDNLNAGIMKQTDKNKKYGFILSLNLNMDIYYKKEYILNSSNYLPEKTFVTFTVYDNHGKPAAKNIRII